MKTPNDIVTEIGSRDVQDALGVSPQAVSNAIAKGYFPPSWFKALNEICAERSVDLPSDLFPWREASEVA